MSTTRPDMPPFTDPDSLEADIERAEANREQTLEEDNSEFSQELRELAELAVQEKENEPTEPAAAQSGADAEIAKLKDQLLRAVAESDNTRKRAERDLQDSRKYAISSFARDLVGVMEHLTMALASVPAQEREDNKVLGTLTQGVEMTAAELLKSMERQGIKRLDPVGEKFNHSFHQAVAQVEDPKAEPGTIVQVLQAGYIIHDRLLRPAMVTVAKAADASQKVDTRA